MLLKIRGAGTFVIENDKIFCENGFVVEANSQHEISLISESVSVSVNHFSGGGSTYSFFGSIQDTSISPNQPISINGIRYKPQSFGSNHVFVPDLPGAVLTIKPPKHEPEETSNSKKNPTSLNLDFNKVSEIRLSGACELVIKQDPPRKLSIHSSGSGAVRSERVNQETPICDNLNLNVSGAGNVALGWVTKNLQVNLSGVGNVSKIKAECNAILNASGCGNMTILASKTANVMKDTSGMAKISVARY